MKRRHSSNTKTRVALISHLSVAETRRAIIKVIFAGLISLCVLAQQALSFGSATFGQGQTISVGVFEFQDESGAQLPAGFTRKIARELAQKLNANHKDLLARYFNTGADASQVKAMPVEQLCALGKQQGIKFIIRGGLLDASDQNSGGEMSVAIQLYADIVSVETLSINSLRAEGSSAARDQALSNAIEQLATLIHQAIISPLPEPATPDKSPQTPADASEQDDPKEVAAGESDEELQQLIAQAELLVADGATGNAKRLASLSQALAALKAALKSKATLLEEGKDTTAADQEVAAKREELQASVSALAQDEMSGESVETEDSQPSGEKKNVLARINEYAGEALGIIQKIQEMRAAFRSESGTLNETSALDLPGEGVSPTLEPTEEINGVVTEMGEPVGGVTVTEPETGVSATTDNNGSYVLQGVAARRLAKLVVTKSGKQLATGQINLVRGRSATADFELKLQAVSKSQPALRIIPSTVLVARSKFRAGSVGVLKGGVKDEQGRPVARALVTLKGLAIARTDSKGNYVIGNVPSGTHQLTIYRSGLKPKTSMVQVAAKKSSESKTQFVATDKIPKTGNRQPLLVRGTGTVLRGTVLDTQKRALTGARITLVQQGSAVSVLAGPQGNYLLRDIKPGSYRALISKAGYDALAQTVVLQAGENGSRDFQLSKRDSPFIEKALVARKNNQSLGARDAKKTDGKSGREGQPRNVIIGTKEMPPVQSKNENLKGSIIRRPQLPVARVVTREGQLKGRIVDAKTGRPIPGVIVSVARQRSVTSDSQGFYAIDDLLAGTHQVIARKGNFLDSITSLVIRPGETTTVNIRLNPRPSVRFR